MKRYLFVALLLCSALAHAGEDQVMAVYRNNATNFKDRELAFCIAEAYKESSAVREDAADTGKIHLEWTYFDLETTESGLDVNTEGSALIGKYLRRDYSYPIEGYVGTKFDLLKCIDMYHSPELDELVRKYVPHPDWIGNKPPEKRRK
ncbi:MAG: type VI secretion system amidase immunity protein Tai4 [Azoarcus sp.]|jgi:hypothetical protein|nr:type VI secretion system amidase immunity protein Tai4 [Azoarcus sp.]